MPQRIAAAGSLPEAFGMMKAMQADGLDRGTGCRRAMRRAPAGIIGGGTAEDVGRRPGSPEGRDGRDRRNGTRRRRLPWEPGDIGPAVPRIRRRARKRCAPQTPSNGASGRSGEGHGPWGPSATAPPWNAPPFSILRYRNKKRPYRRPFHRDTYYLDVALHYGIVASVRRRRSR